MSSKWENNKENERKGKEIELKNLKKILIKIKIKTQNLKKITSSY